MSEHTDTFFYKSADDFFRTNAQVALTYDDITLATRYSEVLPRMTNPETSLSEALQLSMPIVSADMDTVTEAPMAIAMANNGGIGLIHYNMSERAQIKQVARVKNNIHGLIQDPISVQPDMHIAEVLEMMDKRGFKFSTFPVVDDTGKLLGLLPGRAVKQRYRDRTVLEAMQPREQVFTLNQGDIEGDPITAADKFFNEHLGIHKLLVVNNEDKLAGLFTLSDIERIAEEGRENVKPARDDQFRLVCGAAVSAPRTPEGAIDRDKLLGHVTALVHEGVDVVAVSTAHGHTAGVGEAVRLLREQFPALTLIAGNVTSGEGVRFLADAGANAIKVGQGPGSICTTRIVAGVGIPQLTALYVATREAAKAGVKIIADGGITKSGDIVKALTLADAVMCGGLLAGCPEAPGKIMEINGKLYKQYRGMGSLEAMKAGSAARYGHSNSARNAKVAAEGVEAVKEVSDSVDQVLAQLIGGIQSGMGYLGASNLAELRERARYIRVSPAGQRESSPHDIVEIKTSKDSV